MIAPRPDFDPLVLKAMAKWPDVPECYGWLALDRRGNWRLQGEIVRHARAIDFLNRHYTHTEDGRWYVQNGPQRVFVDLACTPLVCREDAPGRLVAHTGGPLGAPAAVILIEDDALVLATDSGPALLDDRDLIRFTAALALPDGALAGDALLARILDEPAFMPDRLCWHAARPAFLRLPAAALPGRYGYVTAPRPATCGAVHG